MTIHFVRLSSMLVWLTDKNLRTTALLDQTNKINLIQVLVSNKLLRRQASRAPAFCTTRYIASICRSSNPNIPDQYEHKNHPAGSDKGSIKPSTPFYTVANQVIIGKQVSSPSPFVCFQQLAFRDILPLDLEGPPSHHSSQILIDFLSSMIRAPGFSR